MQAFLFGELLKTRVWLLLLILNLGGSVCFKLNLLDVFFIFEVLQLILCLFIWNAIILFFPSLFKVLFPFKSPSLRHELYQNMLILLFSKKSLSDKDEMFWFFRGTILLISVGSGLSSLIWSWVLKRSDSAFWIQDAIDACDFFSNCFLGMAVLLLVSFTWNELKKRPPQ